MATKPPASNLSVLQVSENLIYSRRPFIDSGYPSTESTEPSENVGLEQVHASDGLVIALIKQLSSVFGTTLKIFHESYSPRSLLLITRC